MLKKLFAGQTAGFVLHFSRAYPGRTSLMVGLLIVAGLAEGVGLLTLLPLLEYAVGEGGAESEVTQTVTEVLGTLGIPAGLGPLLAVIVAALTLKAFFRWMAQKQVGYIVAQVATDLRLRLIRALLDARWGFFVLKPTGYFANAISSEAGRASNAYRMACQAMAGVIQVVVYLGVVVMISWEVALIALVVAPAFVYVLKRFVSMSREAGDEQTEVMKNLIGRITSLLPGLKPIKAMARERHLIPFLEQETKNWNRARRRSVLATESLKAFHEPIIVAVLSVGLYGAVTIGTASASAVIVAAVLFYRVMTTAGNLQTQYQSVTVNESAFWSLLETVKEAEAASEDLRHNRKGASPRLEQGVRLKRVSFAYEDEAVLRSVTMDIPANQLISVLGPSGAGKTTLIDLVAGLLEPDEGEIYVDGIPLGEIDLIGWRSQIGYVPQDVLLFHDSVLQNVTLGDDSFGRSEVQRALRDAGAWDFVSRLPAGMDQVIGERGAQVSGGQRQRIAIARALLGRPRLLILDEATTALDPETEQEVCGTLVSLRGETTILSISHQKAIREVSDVVYRLSAGEVSAVDCTVETATTAVDGAR